MKNVRGELARLKKLVGASRGPAQYVADLEKHHAAVEVWERAFIAGGDALAGPVPRHPHPMGMSAEWYERTLRGGACLKARMDGAIPACGYLRDMRPQDRRYVDRFCGLLYSVDQAEFARGLSPDGPEGPFPWPEWSRYESLASETFDGPIGTTGFDAEAEAARLQEMSDEELDAEARRLREQVAREQDEHVEG